MVIELKIILGVVHTWGVLGLRTTNLFFVDCSLLLCPLRRLRALLGYGCCSLLSSFCMMSWRHWVFELVLSCGFIVLSFGGNGLLSLSSLVAS